MALTIQEMPHHVCIVASERARVGSKPGILQSYFSIFIDCCKLGSILLQIFMVVQKSGGVGEGGGSWDSLARKLWRRKANKEKPSNTE